MGGSVVLTMRLNLLPMLLPKTARRAQERMIAEIDEHHDGEDDTVRAGPSVKVFFPWRAMWVRSSVLNVPVTPPSHWRFRRPGVALPAIDASPETCSDWLMLEYASAPKPLR